MKKINIFVLILFSSILLLNSCNKEDVTVKDETPYFIIRNDSYITSYLNSLTTIGEAPKDFMDNLLSLKFEELIQLWLIKKMLYLKKLELLRNG